MIHPVVYNTSEICRNLGVRHVVISPGSRNAPLTISFARNDQIKKWIIPDERSAGFIALGIAQTKKEPVVLVCTSGTAVLNYAPAIAEAYYREIPLIVLSADRPLELIDQRDGQTIRQFGVLKNHVKNSYQLPIATNQTAQEYLNKIVEGVMHSQEVPLGPVHLNIPFSEPLYPAENQILKFSEINIDYPRDKAIKEDIPVIDKGKKILVLIGQQNPSDHTEDQLTNLAEIIPVLHSPLSNLAIDKGIEFADLFIKDQNELRPDILITSGLSVLSKKLKNFIRKVKPDQHWHLDPAGVAVDTYGSNPSILRTTIENVCDKLIESEPDKAYLAEWKNLDQEAFLTRAKFLDSVDYSELYATSVILNDIPTDSILHLGNSMPVRYAEILEVPKGVEVYSNRGTSGIDGVTSTAVGTALANPNRLNVLIIGDLSFLYDRNAFFHNYQVPNLRIVVMNNAGGGIFRLIDGPSRQPELEEYFETRHNFSAKSTCLENNLEYQEVGDKETLSKNLEEFFASSGKSKLIEIHTDPEINQRVYREFRNCF